MAGQDKDADGGGGAAASLPYMCPVTRMSTPAAAVAAAATSLKGSSSSSSEEVVGGAAAVAAGAGARVLLLKEADDSPRSIDSELRGLLQSAPGVSPNAVACPRLDCVPVTVVRYDDRAAAAAVRDAIAQLGAGGGSPHRDDNVDTGNGGAVGSKQEEQCGAGTITWVLSSHRAVTAMQRARPLLQQQQEEEAGLVMAGAGGVCTGLGWWLADDDAGKAKAEATRGRALVVGARTAAAAAAVLGLSAKPPGGAANAAALCAQVAAERAAAAQSLELEEVVKAAEARKTTQQPRPLLLLRLCAKASAESDAKAARVDALVEGLSRCIPHGGGTRLAVASVYEMVPVPVAEHVEHLRALGLLPLRGTIELGPPPPPPPSAARHTAATTTDDDDDRPRRPNGRGLEPADSDRVTIVVWFSPARLPELAPLWLSAQRALDSSGVRVCHMALGPRTAAMMQRAGLTCAGVADSATARGLAAIIQPALGNLLARTPRCSSLDV
eukprot:COSAG01_NODE_4645_length_4854_cov_12.793901_5_plen_497_part_00